MLFLAGLLTAILFLLKVLGYIAVSWWLVAAPVLIVIGSSLVFWLFIGGTALMMALFK